MLESTLIQIFRSSHANLEENFQLYGLTRRHTVRDMKATFAMVLGYLNTCGPNKYEPGRQSPFTVPDAISKGTEIMTDEEGRRKGFASQREDVTEGGENTLEEEGLSELDITADDLATESLSI